MACGTVLVIGGCGFVGFHVVQCLLSDPSFTSVHVVSRNPDRNCLTNVSYHRGDITSYEAMHSLIKVIQPRTIIHTASPVAYGGSSDVREFYRANVDGTKNLLRCAAEVRSVQAFVYTSSTAVIAGIAQSFADENAPVLQKSSQGDDYAKSKAIADTAVLAANDKSGLRTMCLRITLVYGERDNQMIPGALELLNAGRENIQIGNNKNLWDYCSVTNVAAAHVLAVKAILGGIDNPNATKVDGEAFIITDGAPAPFWDFERMVWTAAGARLPEKVHVIPAWFMLALASTVEWIYWIFTFGLIKPRRMRRHLIEYSVVQRTFSIEKAKRLLGYNPVDDRAENIAKGVAWVLKKEKAREAKQA